MDGCFARQVVCTWWHAALTLGMSQVRLEPLLKLGLEVLDHETLGEHKLMARADHGARMIASLERERGALRLAATAPCTSRAASSPAPKASARRCRLQPV